MLQTLYNRVLALCGHRRATAWLAGVSFAESSVFPIPPDAMLVPIGAYEPDWFMQEVHVSPPEAVEAARVMDAGHVLPVHWGTFQLASEPMDEPPRAFKAAARLAGIGDRAHVWNVGEPYELPPR